VTFQARGTVQGDYGEEPVWTDSVTLWADAALPGGTEGGAGRDAAVAGVELALRYRTGITTAMRVVYRGANYDIESVTDPDGRGRKMLVRAVAREGTA
jgi:SPP1 family predicted phage head-tail adaptor